MTSDGFDNLRLLQQKFIQSEPQGQIDLMNEVRESFKEIPKELLPPDLEAFLTEFDMVDGLSKINLEFGRNRTGRPSL